MVWSIGGDENYERVFSLFNILRQCNPTLKGYSTGIMTVFPDSQNATHNRLNVVRCYFTTSSFSYQLNFFPAKSGDHSYNMIDQVDLVLFRLKNEE